MDIQLEKLEAIKKLIENEDPTIINSVKEVFSKKKKDWWDELSYEQKEDVAKSELEFEKGEHSDFESVMQKYR
ncbi:hypothetical protein B4N84_25555 [Flavobacterium sp. IR1]|nr:hypothetical protein B4N84_25555 [Flavobacterium sp. IR1]